MTQPISERFWSKVEKCGPIHPALKTRCWVWTGSRARGGYGQLWGGGPIPLKSHRFSWEQANGPIVGRLLVCHHCDNPPCVNPAHLFLGDHKDNAKDMVAKGRCRAAGMPGEKHWASRLTSEQVLAIRFLRKSTTLSQREIGDLFLIKQCTVSAICLGSSWGHLADAGGVP